MSAAATVLTFAVGAVLLALWLDARRPAASLRLAALHTVAAFLVVQALPAVMHALEVDRATSFRLAAILFVLVLPAFGYCCFALARLLRVLAGAWSLR